MMVGLLRAGRAPYGDETPDPQRGYAGDQPRGRAHPVLNAAPNGHFPPKLQQADAQGNV